MVDYADLLLGEVLLGDPTNTYLYVGEDKEAQQLMMGCFIRRVMEEEQQITSALTSIGKVVVNGTQRFVFVNKNEPDCTIQGMSFNRIFVDVYSSASRDRIKRATFSRLVYHEGDFV